MPATPLPRRQPTEDWDQLRLLVTSSEQETYELLRPVVLFGQPATARAGETGVAERTLRRKAARFAAAGMRSLFEPDDPPAPDRRVLPLGIRRAIVELKAEYPPLGPFAIARICRHRFDRPVSYHTVAEVLAADPLPLHPPRRLPRYRDIADPVQRRKAIVDLYLDGWRPTAIAGYLSPPSGGTNSGRWTSGTSKTTPSARASRPTSSRSWRTSAGPSWPAPSPRART